MRFFGRAHQHDLTRANQDRNARKWRSAVKHYRAYLKGQPGDGVAWAQLALCLIEDGHLGDAAQAYDRAQSLMPLDPDLRLRIGHLAKSQGDIQTAVTAYQRALELDPQLQAAKDELLHLDAQSMQDRKPSAETKPDEITEPTYDLNALVDVERDQAANKREAEADPDRVARSADAIAEFLRRLPISQQDKQPILVPKMLHFIYGFKAKGDIPYYGYMAIRSALHFNPGWTAYYYTMHEPSGPNWTRIRDQVTLVEIGDFEYFGNARLHHYAHKADIVRLLVLTEVGGVYLDLDSITRKSFEDLRSYDFVMAVQAAGASSSSGLCNAIMVGKKHAAFPSRWLAKYDYFRSRGRDDLWDHHSVKMPVSLAAQYPDEITVLDYRVFFFPLWTSIQQVLFSDGSARFNDYFEPAYAFHLWNGATGEWLDKIDDTFVRTSPSIYARIAREVCGFPDPGQSVGGMLADTSAREPRFATAPTAATAEAKGVSADEVSSADIESGGTAPLERSDAKVGTHGLTGSVPAWGMGKCDHSPQAATAAPSPHNL